METNPITIGKKSYWTSRAAKFFWIGFCLLMMVGGPALIWFTAKDFYPRTIDNLIHGTPIVGFEVFAGGLLFIFGMLPKVHKASKEG